MPTQEVRITREHGPVVRVLAQICTIEGLGLADMPEICCVVGLDDHALAGGGARRQREGLLVFLFSLNWRVGDVAEIDTAEGCVGHGKVRVGLDRSAKQRYRIVELSLMPECRAIRVLF